MRLTGDKNKTCDWSQACSPLRERNASPHARRPGAGRTGVPSDRKRHGHPSRNALRGAPACVPPAEGTPQTVRTGGRSEAGNKKIRLSAKITPCVRGRGKCRPAACSGHGGLHRVRHEAHPGPRPGLTSVHATSCKSGTNSMYKKTSADFKGFRPTDSTLAYCDIPELSPATPQRRRTRLP